jgi:GntR family transcriptional regulator, transcriptional repressor for pyruvate dehydrogenase complex
MAMEFSNLRTAGKLSERVRKQLEDAILSGKVKVNEQLPTETDLGISFGVSRTVIREALQRLEGQGLIHSRIGSGSYVSPYPLERMKAVLERFTALNPQAETFMNLLDLRIVIETETCGRLAERHDAQAISDLHDILKRMHQCRKRLDELANADMDFHVRIARASGNPFFPTILEPLKNVVQAFGLATYESDAVIDRTCQEHQAILQAVTDGDVETSRKRMRDHIGYSRTHYLELLARQKSATPVS